MHYVMSDIHGNLRAFESIMEQINLQSSDTLYVMGDVSDRHPFGMNILRKIMNMSNAKMVFGNHELLMMEALGFAYDQDSADFIANRDVKARIAHWYINGGEVTHNSWAALPESVQGDVVDYIKSMPLNISLDVNGRKFRLVHGTSTEIYDTQEYLVAKSDSVRTTRAYFCAWDRETVFTLADHKDCITIFGHTPVASISYNPDCQSSAPMKIFHDGNIIGIDCGSGWPYGGRGRLACLRLDDMREFYSPTFPELNSVYTSFKLRLKAKF